MPPENEQRPGQGASRSSRTTGQPMSEPIVGRTTPLQQPARALNQHDLNGSGGVSDPLPPRLLRSKEAASYIGVGTRTLWTLTNLRQIQAVRFDTGGRGSVRYDREDLDAWIEVQKAGPASGGAR